MIQEPHSVIQLQRQRHPFRTYAQTPFGKIVVSFAVTLGIVLPFALMFYVFGDF